MNLKNRRFLPDCTPLCLAMYMDVHKIKKGRDISFLFGGGREREEAAAAPHELLTGAAPSYRHFCECLDARVLFIFLRS